MNWTHRVELRPPNEAKRRLRIAVTPSCNLHCFFCHGDGGQVDFQTVKDSPLSIQEINDIVKIAKDCGVEKIKLTGGEPLLYKNKKNTIFNLIESLSSIKTGIPLDISMVTNGTILTKQICQDLKNSGLMRLSVSLHAVDKSLFSEYSQGKTSLLNRVLAGIKNSVEMDITPVKINCVVFHSKSNPLLSNINQIKEILDVGAQYRASEIRFFVILSSPFLDQSKYIDTFVSWEDAILSSAFPNGLVDYLKQISNENNYQNKVFPGSYRLILKYTNNQFEWPELSFQKFSIKKDSIHQCTCQEGSYAIRLISTGKLRSCLMDQNERDILQAVRSNEYNQARRIFIACQESLHVAPEEIRCTFTE